MKRVNVIIDSDLYDKARTMAFLRRASISEIIRKALREWMEKNLDKKAEFLLSEIEKKSCSRSLKRMNSFPQQKSKSKKELIKVLDIAPRGEAYK